MQYEETLRALWEDIKKKRSRRAPTVVSLFAGGGGSSMGYKAAGCDVRLAVEWNEYAAESYRANFPETHVHLGDVTRLTVDRALQLARLAPGELDILDGSPPCQGFSTAGKRDVGDPRNSLFRDYVRLLRGFRPKAFVMENVAGMVRGPMRWAFARILMELKAAGYRVTCRLMNAKWYGVPQSRQRVIFVGLREDLGRQPSHPEPLTLQPLTIADACPWFQSRTGTRAGKFRTGWERGSDTNRPAPTLCATAGNVSAIEFSSGWNAQRKLSGRSPSPCIQARGIAGSSSTQAHVTANAQHPRAAYIPAPHVTAKVSSLAGRMAPGQGLSDVSDYKTKWLHRVNPNRPSSTIVKTATYLNGPAMLAPSGEARGLSVGEVMRLCSFPDEYVFPRASSDRATWAAAWGVCGNSVPPLLARAIAAHVLELLGAVR